MGAEEKTQYRSKLLGREAKKGKPQGALTRGMGSAYPENQALAGADNPEAAAQLAGMDPAEVQRRSEQASNTAADIEEKRQEMVYARDEEGWDPPGSLDEADPVQVMKWYPALEAWRNETIDAEVEEEVEQGVSFGLEPDDPLYDPLRDVTRKLAIEKDLKPLDFESMVFVGYTEQEVRVRENFTVDFRTISTQHGMWIEMMLTDLQKFSAQYGRHWFSLTQVAVALQTVNGKPIGGDITRFSKPEEKDAFRDILEERMAFLGRMPGLLTDELIVQHAWFVGRVRKMMAGDLTKKVGNS
tara:strand:- start:545 stop:1441 length:897 start_codon:yes stop_codon:yes gene_type:complete